MKHAGTIALLVTVMGAAAAALMLFGGRLGLWGPNTGFGLFRTYFNPPAAIIAGAGLLALAIPLARKGKAQAILGGVAAGLGVALSPPLIAGTLNPTPRAAPNHDISANAMNPPHFEVLGDTRAGASN